MTARYFHADYGPREYRYVEDLGGGRARLSQYPVAHGMSLGDVVEVALGRRPAVARVLESRLPRKYVVLFPHPRAADELKDTLRAACPEASVILVSNPRVGRGCAAGALVVATPAGFDLGPAAAAVPGVAVYAPLPGLDPASPSGDTP